MVVKGYEGLFKGNVKEFKKVLDNFPAKAPVIINGSVDIMSHVFKDGGSFGCTIVPSYTDSSDLFSVGEILGDPPKNNEYRCRRKNFDFEKKYKEEINNYEKASVGELISTLETFPSDCKVMFDNILIENNNGILNDRFNEPVKNAYIEYVPSDGHWNFEIYAIKE